MQELKSANTALTQLASHAATSGASGEKQPQQNSQENILSKAVITVDPHNATLVALVAASESKVESNQPKPSGPSGPQGAILSVPTTTPGSEITQKQAQTTLDELHYRSIEQLQAERSIQYLFSNEKAHYSQVPPELTAPNRDKQLVNFADTYSQPQCLRFDPKASSATIELSLSGLTAKSTAQKQTAIGNMSFSEERVYWEIICPLGCNSLNFGVISQGDTPVIIKQSFMATSKRTIGVEIDIPLGMMRFFLNGKASKKQKNMNLKPAGLAWRPYVEFLEPRHWVVLNPFISRLQSSHNGGVSNSKLPNTLFTDAKFTQLLYLTTFLENKLVVIDLPEKNDEADQLIRKIWPDQEFEIKLLEPIKDGKNVAALSFMYSVDAVRFTQRANKLKVMGPRQLAKLLMTHKANCSDFVPVFDKIELPVAKQLKANHSEALRAHLLPIFENDAQKKNFEVLTGIFTEAHAEIYAKTKDLVDAFQVDLSTRQKSFKDHPVLLGNSEPEALATFLSASNKLCVTKGPELKLFSKETTNSAFLAFSNYPTDQEDKIALQIKHSDLVFLIEKVDWNSTSKFEVIPIFLELFKNTYNGSYALLPYVVALQAVQRIQKTVRKKYVQFERFGQFLQEQDLHCGHVIGIDKKVPTISFVEIQKLFSITVDLEDQLWAMAQGVQICSKVKKLWPPHQARIHTAFGRLSSFLNFDDSEMPLLLAESGLFNYSDKKKQLGHFQEPRLPIENVFEHISSGNSHQCLSTFLEKQMVNNFLLKGLPTWNVPLARTLNMMPPVLHKNFLPKKVYESTKMKSTAQIDHLKAIHNSSFLLSGSEQDGSVNIWTTQLKAHQVGGYNFKNQEFSINHAQANKLEFNTVKSAKLYFKNMRTQKTPAGVEMWLKHGIKAAEEQPLTQDEVASELFGGLFGDQPWTVSDQQSDTTYKPSDYDFDEAEWEPELQQDFNWAWQSPLVIEEKPVIAVEEKKEEQKEKPVVSVVEPQKDDLAEKHAYEAEKVRQELQMMGFNLPAINKAIAAGKPGKLNVQDLVEEILKIQTEAPVIVAATKLELYKPYICSMCTFANPANQKNCQICTAFAPDSAKIVEESKPTEVKVTEFEPTAQPDKDPAALDSLAALEKAREQEEAQKVLHQTKVQEAIAEAENYYASTKITDFLFARNNQGKKLLLAGAVFQNESQKQTDIHFVNFSFKQKYLDLVKSREGLSDEQLQHFMKRKQLALHCLFPQLVGLDGEGNGNILKASRMGAVRVPFNATSVCQVGDNISPGSPMFVIVNGFLENSTEQTACLISIDHDMIVTVQNEDFFNEKLKALVQENVTSMHFSASCDPHQFGHLVVQTVSGKIFVLKASIANKDVSKEGLILAEAEPALTLEPNEQVKAVRNGMIVIYNSESATQRFFALDAHLHQLEAEQADVVSSLPIKNVDENAVLQMQIDPSKITVNDIEHYEKLLVGRTTLGYSNATYKTGHVKKDSGAAHNGVFVQHIWTNEHSNARSEVGPIQLKFDKPTSLMSLNIDLTLTCQDNAKLFELLQSQSVPKTEEITLRKAESESTEFSIDTKNPIIGTTQSAREKLGLLSIKGLDCNVLATVDASKPVAKSDKEKMETAKKEEKVQLKKDVNSYLPLVVRKAKGAQYNATHLASRVVINNDTAYASNYGRPEIVFAHAGGERIHLERFTVRSTVQTKSGAYPIGEGLIFLSDTLQPFEQIDCFKNFDQQSYRAWRQQRMKDPRPLRSNEPVAFFQMSELPEMTFDVDFRRSAKYILFKPTGFRRTPVHINQNVENTPMELQFFGAIGSSSDVDGLNSVIVNDPAFNTQTNLCSAFDCEVRLIGVGASSATVVKNFKIDQLKVYEDSLNPETLLKSAESINKFCKISGLCLIRITDSSLQLSKIKEVQVVFKPTSESQCDWVFTTCSIQGIQAMSSDSTCDTLFGNSEIPTNFYRSCLMSPKFFSVINKQITSLISDATVSPRLRLKVTEFLQKIMVIDPAFAPLILKEIDLAKFLEVNIIYSNQDQSTSQVSSELLQKFQSDPDFAQTLFEILLSHVQNLTNTYISQEGYQAIMGMLKWAMPLDYRRTLEVLISVLLKPLLSKVKDLQTNACVTYRTRQNVESSVYPFDTYIFQTDAVSNGAAKSLVKKTEFSKRRDIIKYFEHHRIINSALVEQNTIYFGGEVTLKQLKIYFSNPNVAFSFDVEISDDDKIVFFQSYDQQVYAQFTLFANDDHSDSAFTIPNLNYKCVSKKLQVKISYGHTSNTIAKSLADLTMPKTFFEFYGHMDESNLVQAKLLSKFWQGGFEGKKTEKQQIRNSISFVEKGVGGKIYLPVFEDDFDEVKKVVAETLKNKQGDYAEDVEEIDEQKERKPQDVEEKCKDLGLFQNDLIVKLQNDQVSSDGRTIATIVEQISKIQLEHTQVLNTARPSSEQANLQFLIIFAQDILNIFAEVLSSPNKEVGDDFLRVTFLDASGCDDLAQVCLELFSHFVVFEDKPARTIMSNFLSRCVFPMLSKQEKQKFFHRSIDLFLTVPQGYFSQKAVIEALHQLQVPESDLILYMAQKLNITTDSAAASNLETSPICMMTSVLLLSNISLKKLEIPEFGKVVHLGVSCSMCKKKAIVGCRYKCGHCQGDRNFCTTCYKQHSEEHPDHCFILMKEPLPFGAIKKSSPSKKDKQAKKKPLLVQFDFIKAEGKVVHSSACESCNSKEITGNAFKCANCEDFVVCNKCFWSDKQQHPNTHVFIMLTQKLQESHKTQISLLPVLDSRLYSESQNESQIVSIPAKRKQSVEEDDLQDIAPIAMSRSKSAVVKVGSDKKETKKEEILSTTLTYNQQYTILFKTAVWVCDNKKGFFSSADQITLLTYLMQNLCQLGKVASAECLLNLAKDSVVVQNLYITIMGLNDANLQFLFSSLWLSVKERHTAMSEAEKKKPAKSEKSAANMEKKQTLIRESELLHDLQKIMISTYQTVLSWLIDIELEPQRLSDIKEAQQLLKQCQGSKNVWIQHMNYALDGFLDNRSSLKSMKAFLKTLNEQPKDKKQTPLEKIVEDLEDEDELAPLAISRSLSLPISGTTAIDKSKRSSPIQIIKNLVAILTVSNKQREQEPYLPQLWKLTLGSLGSVSIKQLVEVHLLEQMIHAFLQTSEDIQQQVFPQILEISQKLATQEKEGSGKLLVNLLLTTLDSTDSSSTVAFSICQGWLDILLTGNCNNQNGETLKLEGSDQKTYALLTQEDVSRLLNHTASYLVKNLNQGTFEGPSGSKTEVMMRLYLAYDMLLVVNNAKEPKGENLALKSLFASCQQTSAESQRLLNELKSSLNNLLLWLFLNGRVESDNIPLQQLYNTTPIQPATYRAKRITLNILILFELVSDCPENDVAIKAALSALMKVVNQMNQSLVSQSEQEQIGYDCALSLSSKTNNWFTQLLSQWLVSDKIVNYFVFELKGFAFLLDTIATDTASLLKEDVVQMIDTSSKPTKKVPAMSLSDLSDFPGFVKVKAADRQEAKKAPIKASEEKKDEDNFSAPLTEMAKTMKLESCNRDAILIKTYANVDWAVNKKVYKHKLLNLPFHNEIILLFKLPQPTLLREVQIGFVNYWPADQEFYLEPLSVVMQAGPSADDLKYVFTLDVVKDVAFSSVQAVVYGKQLQEYAFSRQTVSAENLESVIQQKLMSLRNCKAEYIQFRMRRGVMTCLENSPLAAKISKPQALGINYISVVGYDLNLVHGSYADVIKREQKKTALEVMSLICSNEFGDALTFIANQPETIEKIKNQFDLLISLQEIKSEMIEPTLISISAHNKEMGNWIIQRLILKKGFEKHAALAGKIIVCDKDKVAERLKMLLSFILERVAEFGAPGKCSTVAAELLSYITIFVKTVHLIAPDLQSKSAPIDFKVNQTLITKFFNCFDDVERCLPESQQSFIQFVVLLVIPPAPFVNTSIDVTRLACDVLLNPSDERLYTTQFASILASQNATIAKYIFETQRDLLDNLLQAKSHQNKRDLLIASFWLNVSKDPYVKACLQKEKLPVAIYEAIKEKDPATTSQIMKAGFSEEYLVLLTELVLSVSAGCKELEDELAQKVIQDIEHLGKHRDMFFINRVLLPLIRNEAVLPVCLVESLATHKQNDSWTPNYEVLSEGTKTTVKKIENARSSFLPTTLLIPDVKATIVKGFQELVGKVSNKHATQALGAHWSLAHTTSDTQGKISGFVDLWRSIENKPIMMLIKGQKANNDATKVVFGGYCSKPMPSVPATMDQDQDYPVNLSPEDFLFCWIEGQGVHFFRVNGQYIIEFFTDYEQGGAISMGMDFMLISNSYDFQLTVGNCQQVKQVEMSTVPNPKQDSLTEIAKFTSNFKLETAEIWTCCFDKKGTACQAKSPETLKQAITTSINSTSLTHPWNNVLSPYNYFRSRSVFMVPQHIQIKQLSQILLNAQVPLNLQTFSEVLSDETVEEVYFKKLMANVPSVKHNNILDFEFCLDQVFDFKENSIKAEVESDDFSQRVTTQYAPQNGFFDAFENHHGVKKFIQVTLASLSFWNDKKLAESWSLWLKELDSFSEIPFFFQLFLKNKKCKELLFKVLSGEPDQAVDAVLKQTWELQQKESVQFNYKILSDAFETSKDSKLRTIAIQCGFLPRILERLSAISGEKPRVFEEEQAVEEILAAVSLEKESSVAEDGTRKKRKGVGYSSKQGETFNVTAYLDNKKQRNDQIKILVDIICNFLLSDNWEATEDVLNIILESALLPLIENAFRNGSWLDMAKENEVYHSYLALTRALANQPKLISCLVEIDQKYKPNQIEPIHKLLGKLNDLASIFLNCLNQQQNKLESTSVRKQEDNFDVKKEFKTEPQKKEKLNQPPQLMKLQEQTDSSWSLFNVLSEPFIPPFKAPLGGSNSTPTNQMALLQASFNNHMDFTDSVIDMPELVPSLGEFPAWKNPTPLKVESDDDEYETISEKTESQGSKTSQSEDGDEDSAQSSDSWETVSEKGTKKFQPPKNTLLHKHACKHGAKLKSVNKKKDTPWGSEENSDSEYDSELSGSEESKSQSSSSAESQQTVNLEQPTETPLPFPQDIHLDPELSHSEEQSDNSSSTSSNHNSWSESEAQPSYESEGSYLVRKVAPEEMSSEVPEKLAKDVTLTFRVVMEAVEELLLNQRGENFIEDALALPVPQQYRALLVPLRFDYMDMKQDNSQEFKHHYKTMAQQNQSPPASKLVRLAQELADLSNALPTEHTNSIYVRVDKARVDLMKACIAGAEGTPYAHGFYEFDIFFENTYPNGPPKMNLSTTGSGAIRFNPNLYACGKVCLSLLGTWRGSATENWDPKLSTILQVLVSVQAIIMSEEVYFNEPGFENEAGTPDGEKRNEGYMNIVRYGNVKYAMVGQLKSPSKGFETVIKRHFYVKQAEILRDVHSWIARADKHEAMYTGLVSDHNHTIAAEMKKSKDRYKEMLQEVVKQLEEELAKLEKPTNYQIKPKAASTKKRTQKKTQAITEGQQMLDDVDMGSDEETLIIDTSSKKEGVHDIDIDDDAVKDRWSRYIGAMGVEAVAKQAAAHIFLSGAGALGVEIAKNLVLSGCKSFTLHDVAPITVRDLSGQFFLSASDKQKTRSEACLHRLQQLNFYVRCKLAPTERIPLDHAKLEQEPWNFQNFDVVILTDCDYKTIITVNEYCRLKNKKFICSDLFGVFGRVFNDFGPAFEVLDKNGEELQDVLIKSISNEEKGLVELLPGNKHKFEDGDEILFTGIEGMTLLEGENHDDPLVKSDSINDEIHKVVVQTTHSFRVGDTRKFSAYIGGGIGKQLRTKLVMKFDSFQETMLKGEEQLPTEMNLAFADFEKMANNKLAHICFEAIDMFRESNKGCLPKSWDLEEAQVFVEMAKKVAERYGEKPAEWKNDGLELKLIHVFAFQASGVFNPMAAFFGGFVAQEAVKAITNKFAPTKQLFYYDAFEVTPDFDLEKHIKTEDNENFFAQIYVPTIAKTKEVGHRSDGLKICIGETLLKELEYTRLFMVGAGAIGCELLKNFAMLGVGTGKKDAEHPKPGSIVLTDPDIIEVSNLNRQFLFREKHLRLPKSQTAAAAAIYMNPDLKGNVIARLDKVYEGSAHIFTDKFFEELTIVTNALDNVKARLYIDARCVTAKTPLLESGTLGPKGHIQVVLPHLTESYGSMQDPEDNTEIPMCTLKMFPEEALHCIEWARDKFGKMFSVAPLSAVKVLEEGSAINPISQQDVVALKEGLKLLRKRPKSFVDCVEFARLQFEKRFNHDIKQLMHVYPVDAKTKEGNLFWSLPKRPPTPIDFDPANKLHQTCVASMACLRATIFHIEIPSKVPRSDEFKLLIAQMASEFKMPAFVPNDAKAKEIAQSVEKAAKDKEEEKKTEEKPEEESLDEVSQLKNEFLMLFEDLKAQLKGGVEKIDFEQAVVKAEEFEKDNDANFHIDFMFALGNCRSACYKLEQMDWITVKLKVGRIVPALATTTSSIAGLQTLELVKVLAKLKKDKFRNIFLNLAVPFLQASEPGDVLKEKLVEGLEVSLWDVWKVKGSKTMTLAQLIKQLEETYKGLEVRDVMRGNTPIYFYAIMNAAGKEQDKTKTLNKKIAELAECESDDLYVDLGVTCVRKDDPEGKIISGVPPVRVEF